jgi:hypothetical protein
MYELRAVNSTVKNLYDKVINHYDADVFICAQKTFKDDEERLNLFNKNVVYSELYDKPDPREYFGPHNILDRIDKEKQNDLTWNKYSNLQIYINYHKMANIVSKVIDKYDYFILLRSDVEILFSFPEKELFEKIPEAMYFIDCNYSKEWGDRGIPTIIHRNYILGLLNSYYNVISNAKYIKNLNYIIIKYKILEKPAGLNQERFQNICIDLCNLRKNVKYITSLNYFLTSCSKDNFITTWSIPKKHEKYNVICKYEFQCDEAYKNLNLWLNKSKWEFYNNSICLVSYK